MTIHQVHQDYANQYNQHQAAYKANPKGMLPQINFTQLNRDLVTALQEPPHSFSPARATYIVNVAVEREHSCYDNVFGFVERLSEYIRKVPA